MKQLIIFCFILLAAIPLKAGFVIGYQGGIYTPPMANTQSTMYYYNKVFQANFNYNNFFKGIFIGVRLDEDKGWISMAWNKKQNVFTSEYITPANERYKLSIKTRMNELVLDGGVKYKGWGLGGGFNLANLNVLTKRGKVEEFGAAKWANEYGAPIKILGLPNYPSFSIIGERHFSKFVIMRMTYHFGIGDVTFSNDGSLTFYDFKPKNLTLALLFNLGKF